MTALWDNAAQYRNRCWGQAVSSQNKELKKLRQPNPLQCPYVLPGQAHVNQPQDATTAPECAFQLNIPFVFFLNTAGAMSCQGAWITQPGRDGPGSVVVSVQKEEAITWSPMRSDAEAEAGWDVADHRRLQITPSHNRRLNRTAGRNHSLRCEPCLLTPTYLAHFLLANKIQYYESVWGLK